MHTPVSLVLCPSVVLYLSTHTAHWLSYKESHLPMYFEPKKTTWESLSNLHYAYAKFSDCFPDPVMYFQFNKLTKFMNLL